jgi:hypothetical protein
MNQVSQERPRRRAKLWLAASAAALALALVIVPPLIGISRYKSRITQLVSSALGRQVRLSGVELRLLPRPGFVLTDLTVEGDPAFGSEPVLHASTVDASIRFASLWRGKLQISRISVDEASLNLVRASDGRWNLESLFRRARAGTGVKRAIPQPYLEATNSRINIKNGVEKLPFSLLDADAALWQESDGEWRVRLKGQPARTDVSLDLADTGIVRLEGTLRPATQFDHMPLHVDAEWRDAQLGQLSRLLLGSDEGWRGDLRGELHLDGTAVTAHVQTRLLATGVHREEFAPAAPIDFDATCGFVFHYASRDVNDLACNSPIGDGRAQLMGSIPAGQPPHLTLQLDRIPAQAALDALRTVRSSVDPSIQAAGSISGRLSYDPTAGSEPAKRPATRAAQNHPPAGPFAGTVTVEALRIAGDALSRPIQAAKMTFVPVPAQPYQPATLVTTVAIPAGGSSPLTIRARLALAGFQVAIHGPASFARLREFAHIAGSVVEPSLRRLAGEPATIDLEANGPWLPPAEVSLGAPAAPPARSVQVRGTISVHDANWKAPFLANAVLLHQATLHLEKGAMRWDPVEFSYGPVDGSATLEFPPPCDTPSDCPPQFTARFGDLDAAVVQGALLGAREKGTLLSSLLERLNPSAAPSWPIAKGTVQADSVAAGPFTLTDVSADVKIAGTGAEFTSLNASGFGGKLEGTATFQAAQKPQYSLDASFTGLKPAQVGALLGMKWSGGDISGNAKVEMAGFTDKDLAGSAKGTVGFTWNHGAITTGSVNFPPALAHFDRWTAVLAIANGNLKLGQNQVLHSGKKSAVQATLTFGLPAKVTFTSVAENRKSIR